MKLFDYAVRTLASVLLILLLLWGILAVWSQVSGILSSI